MTVLAPAQIKPHTWQINLAAEGIAAAQFARCGFDVSVQYGAEKPKYDLVVAKGDKLLKVTVKSSQDGLWDIAQEFLRRATEMSGKKDDYHGAVDLWLDHHGSRSVCCLVQFQGVEVAQLPRIYLATPKEIAQRLRASAMGRGVTILYEECEWAYPGEATGTQEKLPLGWRFSLERIQELIAGQEAGMSPKPLIRNGNFSAPIWPASGRPFRDSSTILPVSA